MSNNYLQEAPTKFNHFVPDTSYDTANSALSRHVPVKEAKAKLTELLRAVEAGERIVLTRHGKPIADLVPHVEPAPFKGSRLEALDEWHKKNGTFGKVGWVSPDFDDPLPEDFLITPLPDDFDEPKIVPPK